MNTAAKTAKILRIFLLCFLVIVLKVWHLSSIQREEKLVEAQKPQQRTILVRADRGNIYDRYKIPMATNQISYNAAIYYSQIAQIPSISWKTDPTGKQIKVYSRKEYIHNLSSILAKTLNLDPNRIEDIIHSKAALFPHVPYLLKTDLSEEEHYRLRMMEKDYPGIYAEISSKRVYPQGKVGGIIVGTLGAINQKEYSKIAQEISELELEDEESSRLLELKEKAYSINDSVGKSGIESQFEEKLRGFFGKQTFEVDQKGCFVREIAKKEAVAGDEITLTISSELQQFAEQLLIQSEKSRDGRSIGLDPEDNIRKPLKQPWIKGGAIVALDPKTGEVLALASYPRLNPNDFILKNSPMINRFLENRQHIGALWDGTEVLIREKGTKIEEKTVSWEFYLDSILPMSGPLKTFFQKCDTVGAAIDLQEDYEAMLYFTKANLPIPQDVQRRLDAIPLSPQDKLFAVDVCRLAVYAPAFTDELISKVRSMKLTDYRDLSQKFHRFEQTLKPKIQERFRSNEFRSWREKEQKKFLAEKRKWEKEHKSYAKPYLDYLDQKEKELFNAYWEENRVEILASAEFSPDLIRTFRSFNKLNRPLLGKTKKRQTEKDLAAAFYPAGGFGFNRSFAFGSAVPPGSIFKLITAYEGLVQGSQLTIIDEVSANGVAYTQNRVLYPRYYKGGRLPRSASRSMGKLDLTRALEQSSNPYFAILAGDFFNDPNDLKKAAQLFGLGQKTGIDLPGERKGKIPTDLNSNRTGLYSAAIGQHTLLTTPLQTASMISALVNGGKLFKPKLLKNEKEEIIKTIPMDPSIRNTLLEGMDRVIWGPNGSARPDKIRELVNRPILKQEYLALKHQMVGKTSTAELVCNFSANPSSKSTIYKYIWFGAASFTDTKQIDPELVVVVFLRYGDAGKEAAPIAAQMIHKWRTIKKKYDLHTF